MARKHTHPGMLPYKTIAEASPMGIVLIAPDATIRYANRMFCTLTGYKKSELIGKPFTILRDLVDPKDRQKIWQYFPKWASGKKAPLRDQLRVRTKDGSLRWLEVFAYPIETPEGRLIQTVIVDITDRKKWKKNWRRTDLHNWF